MLAGVTAGRALFVLRTMLAILGVPDAMKYRTHDFRRGHAKDLQMSGAPLYTILVAGEWWSPAFLEYIAMHRLETDLVIQAHLEESDGECNE